MPAPRKTTVIGRGPGKDRAGRTLAERERIESWARRAEAAGLVIDETDDWYRWGIEHIYELTKSPVTKDDIAEMTATEETLTELLKTAGVRFRDHKDQPIALVPKISHMCGIQWRAAQKRGEDPQ